MENKKSVEMEGALEGIAQNLFGRSRVSLECVTCGSKKVNDECFRDDLSRKEFTISKMCQECQDSVFGK